MQRQHEFGGRNRLALHRVDGRKHFDDARDTRLDSFAGAARVLNGHGAEQVILNNVEFLFHAADLKHLAAQPHQQNPANIGVRGIAPLRAL